MEGIRGFTLPRPISMDQLHRFSHIYLNSRLSAFGPISTYMAATEKADLLTNRFRSASDFLVWNQSATID